MEVVVDREAEVVFVIKACRFAVTCSSTIRKGRYLLMLVDEVGGGEGA